MDFKREKPDCRFSIVDRPTVRQQMEYMSLAGSAVGGQLLLRYWEGAKALIIRPSWKCELVKDIDELDIDQENSPEIVSLLVWAGFEVHKYMRSLEDISKNS